MFRVSELKGSASRFVDDNKGNFGTLFALTLPIMLLSASIATDFTSAVSLRGRIDAASDAAAVAAASAMVNEGYSEPDAKALATKFFHSQLGDDSGTFSAFTATPIVNINTVTDADGLETYKVHVSANVDMELNPFTKAVLADSLKVTSSAYAESAPESKSALSMFLVLDRSGSMGWLSNGQPKIDILKTAVGNLMTELDLADPEKKYVRTGVVGYYSSTLSPQKLTWGTTKTRTYTNGLWASGGTDSSGALETAYKQLKKKKEVNKHAAKNGLVPTKYIVFMTDGDNNYSSADTATKSWCDKAKALDMQIFSVAFQAPSGGEALLNYCASSPDHYYDANNAADLIAAFKSIGAKASATMARITQ